MSTRRKVHSVWAMPALLGAASLAGLLIALLADGLADVISMLLLGLPAVLGAWFGYVRR